MQRQDEFKEMFVVLEYLSFQLWIDGCGLYTLNASVSTFVPMT